MGPSTGLQAKEVEKVPPKYIIMDFPSWCEELGDAENEPIRL